MRKPILLTKAMTGTKGAAKQIVLDVADIRKITDEGTHRLVYAGPTNKLSTYMVQDPLPDIVNKCG